MQVKDAPISGLKIVQPAIFGDDRGWFMETWRAESYAELGIGPEFMQDNHSRSVKGTLRGLHFQTEPGQGKLVRCTFGKIWDVAVDIRPNSPTLGQWFGLELDAESGTQFWIPAGFAHGFVVLSDVAEVQYKCTNVYNPKTEAGIAWDDPKVAVDWPVKEPLLSERDQNNPTLAEFLKS